MTTRIVGVIGTFVGAICVLQVTVGGVGAQDPITLRKPVTVTRDTFRLLPPVNENIVVFGYLMQMGQISAELEKIQRLFESEMPGERLTVMRNLSATVQGLQQNAQDRLFQIRTICSAHHVAPPAWLGIAVSEWDYARRPLVQTSLPYPLVSDVEPRSPAAAAGLEPGDEILKVDGVDLQRRQLEEFIKVPGKKLSLTIKRDGALKTMHAVLDSGRARVPEACKAATGSPMVRVLIQRDSELSRRIKINPLNARDTLPGKGAATIVRETMGPDIVTLFIPGSSVAMHSGEMSSYAVFSTLGAFFSSANVSHPADASGTRPGVRVLHVLLDGQADQGGLKREDVVTRVNKKTVTSIVEFKEALILNERLKRVDLEVIRDQKVIPVSIPR